MTGEVEWWVKVNFDFDAERCMVLDYLDSGGDKRKLAGVGVQAAQGLVSFLSADMFRFFCVFYV